MTCQLCLKDKQLCDSHIIPEFIYKPVYDSNNHQYFQITTNPLEKNFTRQKGIWEKLLCLGCEAHLQDFENYASRVLRGGAEIDIVENADKIIFSNINYNKFKLFQMSLLWRASVSNRPEFSRVNVGPHQEKLRELILNKDPGEPYEYGCLIIAPRSMNKVLSKVILAPELIKVDGHRCCRFLFGSMFWLFFVSSHTKVLEHKNGFLLKNGTLPILFEDNWSVQLIQQLAENLYKAEKLHVE